MTLKELYEKLKSKNLVEGFDDERNLTWVDNIVEDSEGCVINRDWLTRDGDHVDVEDVTLEYADLLDDINKEEDIKRDKLHAYGVVLREMDLFLEGLKAHVDQITTGNFSEKYELKRDALGQMYDKITEMKIAIKFIGEENNGFELLDENDFQQMIRSLGVNTSLPKKEKVIN
jgi:hypothetical protein